MKATEARDLYLAAQAKSVDKYLDEKVFPDIREACEQGKNRFNVQISDNYLRMAVALRLGKEGFSVRDFPDPGSDTPPFLEVTW